MHRKYLSAILVLFAGGCGLQASTLVNDFSANISGSSWTDPSDPGRTDGVTSNYTTSYSASVALTAGLVDTGFVTVDYHYPFPPSLTYSYAVYALNDTEGVGLSLSGVTGFTVSLRKETLNSAFAVNFYIIGNNDNVYNWEISTAALSTSQFQQVSINLADNSAWVSDAPASAWVIGVSSSQMNPASARYNLSIDSVSVVPEPSSSLLLVSGLGGLALLRRRFR